MLSTTRLRCCSDINVQKRRTFKNREGRRATIRIGLRGNTRFLYHKSSACNPHCVSDKKYRQYLSNHAKQNKNTSCENHHDEHSSSDHIAGTTRDDPSPGPSHWQMWMTPCQRSVMPCHPLIDTEVNCCQKHCKVCRKECHK